MARSKCDQKSNFRAKFSKQLKISRCCQISSFAGPEWSKVSILSQMFDATENFCILPNFILRMSPVVKNVSFELNFWHESKCWLCKMSSFAGQEWSNSLFQVKFSTRLKISGFCQISSFAGLEWSKIYFLSQIFNTNQNFSRFCQISSFAFPEWSKLSILGLILIVIENFWILPHFILCMSRVVKNVSCELNFWHKSKFLDFAKFHPSQVRSGQNLDCKLNFQRDWKYLDFAIFHPSQVWSGQKSDFFSQIFKTNQNFSGFCQILSFAAGFRVGNTLIFEPNFQHDWKFLDCAKFHPLHVQSGRTLNFGLDFDCNWKFLNFTTFHPLHVPSGQKCLFLAKFSTRLKISWFCKILSFAGL